MGRPVGRCEAQGHRSRCDFDAATVIDGHALCRRHARQSTRVLIKGAPKVMVFTTAEDLAQQIRGQFDDLDAIINAIRP